MYATMKSSAASLLVLATLASAVEVQQYTSQQCTGLRVSAEGVNVATGCVKVREDGSMGMIALFGDDTDVGATLVLYKGENCCHADAIGYLEDVDICQEISSEAGSFRLVDPNNPDPDDTDVYECSSGETETAEFAWAPPPVGFNADAETE